MPFAQACLSNVKDSSWWQQVPNFRRLFPCMGPSVYVHGGLEAAMSVMDHRGLGCGIRKSILVVDADVLTDEKLALLDGAVRLVGLCFSKCQISQSRRSK